MLQYLKLVKENVKIINNKKELNESTDWKMGLQEVHFLFSRLAACPSPGCGIQKYLRWLKEAPADCNVVRSVLVGVSLLPPTFSEMMELVDTKDNTTICFSWRSKLILSWLYQSRNDFQILAKANIMDKKKSGRQESIGSFFNFNKFKLLLEYVMESNERLRLVMAKYHQIRTRGIFQNEGKLLLAWTGPSTIIDGIKSGSPDEHFRKHGRQIEVFLDLILLIKLNNQSPDIRFWA